MKPKILMTGRSGLVGSRFIDFSKEDFEIDAPLIDELNLLDYPALEKYFKNSAADIVFHLAAYTNVDEAEKENGDKDGIVYKLNSLVPQKIAQLCKEEGKHLLYVSTDYVFDGSKADSPYTEEDKPNPLGWYGKTKYFGEELIAESGCEFTIARIHMPYCANYEGKRDFARTLLHLLKTADEMKVVVDQKITPIFIDFAAAAFKRLIESKDRGIFHLAATDPVTSKEFILLLTKVFNIALPKITEVSYLKLYEGRAPRPQYCWLSTKKFENTFGTGILHTNNESVEEFKRQVDFLNIT